MSTWNEIKNSLDKLLVGGAVRDFIMDVKPKDNDWLVTNKTEACMLGLGFERVGKSISTPVFFHSLDPMREDYALPRKETSTGVTTEDFSFDTTNITIEEDLFRRDFTINAIAMYSNEGLFDPFDGYSDIQAKEIRHLDDNAFMEDPLRIFRAARFAAQLSFKIIPDTVALCRKMVSSGLHKKVSADRVREETKKALSCKYPSLYFNALRDFGALEYWFSPIYKMIGIPQPKGHHGEGDVYNHTMMVLEEVRKRTDDVPTLFAALLHDVGKIGVSDKILMKKGKLTKKEQEKLREHAIIGQNILSPIKEIEGVFDIIRHHHENFDGTGYPDGLKGNEIPMISRIIAVSNTYDTMTSDRPHRKAMSKELALKEIEEQKGAQFDPVVTDAFIKVVKPGSGSKGA